MSIPPLEWLCVSQENQIDSVCCGLLAASGLVLLTGEKYTLSMVFARPFQAPERYTHKMPIHYREKGNDPGRRPVK
jgi:hypothetical protein